MHNTHLPLTLLLAFLFAISACSKSAEEPTAAEKALTDLQKKYDELTEGELDNPMQWASDDLGKIGDWEYRILQVSNVSAAEFEATLNEAGGERWEVIWIEKTLEGHSIVMKRPSVSILSKVPLSQIGRLVIGGRETEQ